MLLQLIVHLRAHQTKLSAKVWCSFTDVHCTCIQYRSYSSIQNNAVRDGIKDSHVGTDSQ